MLTKTQSQRLRAILSRFDDIDMAFVRMMAERIAEIHDMEALNFVALLLLIQEQSQTIEVDLNNAVNQSMADIGRIYGETLINTYKDRRFAAALKKNPLPRDARETLDDYAMSVGRDTATLMRAHVQTNKVYDVYQKAANNAFLVATGNRNNYTALTRPTVRDMATKGIRSGTGWRMTNAIRQVILDGLQKVQQKANDIVSAALGMDAKEISVHVNPAADHEPLQGRIFLNSEFQRLQSGRSFKDIDGRVYAPVARPIGALNCRHLAYGFDSRNGARRYSPEELDAMMQRNAQGVYIDGKHYSLYEAKQFLNKLQTEERRQTDIALAAEIVSDKLLATDCLKDLRVCKSAKKFVEEEIEKASHEGV